MFAPDNYCLIESLEDQLRKVLREIQTEPNLNGLEANNTADAFLRLTAIAKFEKRLLLDVRRYTLEILEEIESLSICSPDGRVFKVSKSILTPHSEFEALRLVALAADKQLYPVLLDNSWLVAGGRHFRNSDPSHFEQAIKQRRPNNPEREIRKKLFEFTERFRGFIGWSLVFKEVDLPSLTNLRSKLSVGDAEFKAGRPEKKTKALHAFDAIFPEGRGGVPWKVVAESVGRVMEEPVSVITIKRAINNRT